MAAPLCCACHHRSLTYHRQGGSRCETKSSKTRRWRSRWPNTTTTTTTTTSLHVASVGRFGSNSCEDHDDDDIDSRAQLLCRIATRSWSIAFRTRVASGRLAAAVVSSRSRCNYYTRKLASCVSSLAEEPQQQQQQTLNPKQQQQQRCRGRSSSTRAGGSFRFRVRAGASSQENPLGEEGYWDQAEGKEKLDEIEDLKELLAEGERLQGAGKEEDHGDDENDNTKSLEQLAQERATKLREELELRAKEQAKQKKEAEIMFQMGQRAYGRGVYDKSVEILEAALTKIPRASNLGGEIQIWLAMAYEAHNRHDDCIALYKRLESGHPNKNIKRQAADLRYILEAPKLKISRDEMVSIPIIDKDYDRKAKSWSQTVRDRRRKPMKKSAATRDYLEDWLVWNPPRWERNPYFWVAVTIWLTLVGISLMFQN